MSVVHFLSMVKKSVSTESYAWHCTNGRILDKITKISLSDFKLLLKVCTNDMLQMDALNLIVGNEPHVTIPLEISWTTILLN